MGTTQSSVQSSAQPSAQKDHVKSSMVAYKSLWEEHNGGFSQTEVFRRCVPLEETDFTDVFGANHLNHFFTGERLRKGAGFNCNHLYRSSQDVPRLPVLSTDKYTVLQPMGEPGRDLDTSGTRVSHLMVITHGKDCPITFNEMLPSSSNEISDLEERMGVLETAYNNLAHNVPISKCGEKVTSMAKKDGIDLQTGIRDFLATQISTLTEKEKTELPGYVLKDKDDVNVAEGTDCSAKVKGLINETFNNKNLKIYRCIQPPTKNTQVLSHIHGFLLEGELPEKLASNYVPVDTILEIKKEL